jgi:hypothetical protein
MATGIVEVAWTLSELRQRLPDARPYLDWHQFAAAGRGLFLWEAFVTDKAKATTHVDDAIIAVARFRGSLPDPTASNAVAAERPLSLLGAALLWSGWSSNTDLLRTPCLVIKAAPRLDAGTEVAAARSGGWAEAQSGPIGQPGHPLGPKERRQR